VLVAFLIELALSMLRSEFKRELLVKALPKHCERV